MFTWEALPESLTKDGLVRELNQRMRKLWVLLKGVRKQGATTVFEQAVQVDVGLVLTEQLTAPATPEANTAIFFTRLNGGGKTEFCAKWDGGAISVIATEP